MTPSMREPQKSRAAGVDALWARDALSSWRRGLATSKKARQGSSKSTKARKPALSLEPVTWLTRINMSFEQGASGLALKQLGQARRELSSGRFPDLVKNLLRRLRKKKKYLEAATVTEAVKVSPLAERGGQRVGRKSGPVPIRKERELQDMLNNELRVSSLEGGMNARGEREHIFFRRPLQVSVVFVDQGYACVVHESGLVPQLGLTQEEAVDKAVSVLRKEALRLHQRMTHTLAPSERQLKEQLLGVVDLGRSGLLRPPSSQETKRIFGQVGQDADGTPRFFALGSAGDSFAIPQELLPGLEVGWSGFARVQAGESGEPMGPVQALEQPVEQSLEDTWKQWMQLTGQGG
ncbi:hypothetical protein [Archangium sp.]|jgi:hypothetical protein|uniref:hypothetical protein n=1 Tax=Archangium sp. TaxID=1872627 RepID=UPI002ED864E7